MTRTITTFSGKFFQKLESKWIIDTLYLFCLWIVFSVLNHIPNIWNTQMHINDMHIKLIEKEWIYNKLSNNTHARYLVCWSKFFFFFNTWFNINSFIFLRLAYAQIYWIALRRYWNGTLALRRYWNGILDKFGWENL